MTQEKTKGSQISMAAVKEAVMPIWRSNPAIRDEFNDDFEAYCSYRWASENGYARSIGKKGA